jgi:hypothetical protein
MKNFKFLKIFKIKAFNFNKLIALLISGAIIFCLKYYFNCFGFITDVSLLFIIFCGLLKSIIQITIEYIREPNLNYLDNKLYNKKFIINYNELISSKRLEDIHTYTLISYNINGNNISYLPNINNYFNPNTNYNYFNYKYNSYGNNFSSENIVNYLLHLKNIHTPLFIGRLSDATNLDQVDKFFIKMYIQEKYRYVNRLKELKQEVIKIELLQQLLDKEKMIFINRIDLIKHHRRIYIESLRINDLRYTNKDEYRDNYSNITPSNNEYNVKI